MRKSQLRITNALMLMTNPLKLHIIISFLLVEANDCLTIFMNASTRLNVDHFKGHLKTKNFPVRYIS